METEKNVRPGRTDEEAGTGAARTKNARPESGQRARDARVRAAALRRKRILRRRIGYTLVLVGVLILIALGTGMALYMKRGGTFENFIQPYTSSIEFTGSAAEKENLRSEPFAASLCVFDTNIFREGIELPSWQEGLLLNVNAHDTLYAKDAFTRVYPASITKLVTALIALEYGDMNDSVTITYEDVDLEEGAQVCGFIPGDVLSMDQLLHCLLVYSGNDAAMAIARHVGGTMDGFIALMNQYARSLGCTGTHFVNPHGLQDPEHYTTPYDIYLILKEAAKYPSFTEISQMGSYTVEYNRADGTAMRTILEATDHYLTGEATLPRNVSVLGGKTGTTNEAGNCLALLTQNAYGQPFVSIVMGAETKELLYEQMNMLLQNINET